MKKAIGIVLVVAIVVLTFSLPVCAQENKTNLYFDKFMEYLKAEHNFEPHYQEEHEYIKSVYTEFYHHKNEQGEVEWAVVRCQLYPEPWEAVFGVRVGNRVFKCVGGSMFSRSAHYVYVSETDTLIPLSETTLDSVVELCPDFESALEENNIGQQFGDVDNDGELSVVDATYIQRHIAEYYDYLMMHNLVNPFDENSFMVSDIDHDGETTIMDATVIQHKVAGLE